MALLNPYNFVGEFHNHCLDEISFSGALESKATSSKQTQLIINKTSAKISMLYSANNTKNNEILTEHTVKLTTLWNEFEKNKNNSIDYEKYHLEKDVRFLYQKLEKIAITENSKVIEKLEDIEQDFLSLDAPNEQLCVPLSTIAVAKNSYEYWEEVSTATEKTSDAKFKWRNWLENKKIDYNSIWKDDMKGAFIGGGKAFVTGKSIHEILFDTGVTAVFGSAAKAIFK
jgi:hypothetical protein